MQYYAITDPSGILAFYCDDIHGDNIPVGAIEITELEWQDAISNPGKYSVHNGIFTAASPWPPEKTQDEVKSAKLSELDQAAVAAYVAGFYSTASGTNLYYDSDEDTQKLLEGIYARTKEADWTTKVRYPSVCDAGYAPVRARSTNSDPETMKTIQKLNANQIKVLIDDLDDHIFAVKSHLWAKQAEVQAASDTTAVEAIAW